MTNTPPSPGPNIDATAENVKTPPQQTKVTRNLPYEEVEPWPEAVDLGALLTEIAESIQRHIIAEKEVSDGTTLWIAMTHLIDQFDIAALLIITAPEMRCGKSEFKRLIGQFVFRPVHADNMSAAVLFRSFDMWHPTLLVDEYDTFVNNNEELRGVFNAGHQRGGCVWRCVGEKFVPTPFDVFGAKVLAGIGRLPPTLIDRGIIVPLRRKLPTEITVRQRDVPATYFREIQSKLARMVLDYASAIAAARPPLPDALSDRARDNWEPLFQIAQVAGGDWLARAEYASLKLSSKDEDTKTVGVELLSDIQEAFACQKVDRLSSSEIINILCDDAEKRWATYNRGFPITPTQVAKRLREFGICSITIRVNGTTAKGYFLKQFADAFARYVFADQLESVPAVTSSPAKPADNSAVTSALPLTPPAVTCSANVGAGCDGMTASTEGEDSLPATTNVPGVLYAEMQSRVAAAAHVAVTSALHPTLPTVTPSLDAAPANSSVTTVAPVTPASVTGNGDVTCSANADNDCDGVTADAGGESNLPPSPSQAVFLSEFRELLLKERMLCSATDKEWPEGLQFDQFAEQAKDKLKYVDRRLRPQVSRNICRQLVERGDLVQCGDLLILPLSP
jgi:putative DNA primase/helicase